MKGEPIFKKILELKMKQKTENVRNEIQKLQRLADAKLDLIKEKVKKK